MKKIDYKFVYNIYHVSIHIMSGYICIAHSPQGQKNPTTLTPYKNNFGNTYICFNHNKRMVVLPLWRLLYSYFYKVPVEENEIVEFTGTCDIKCLRVEDIRDRLIKKPLIQAIKERMTK